MTEIEARRVADLLITLDDAREFLQTFSEETRPFISFEDVNCADNIRADGERGGWEGQIRMSRETAIEMMAWLERRALDKLAELDVK